MKLLEQNQKVDLPRELRKRIKISQIPRNMHPEYHKSRRVERARYVQDRYGKEAGVAFTRAAAYKDKDAMTALVVDNNLNIKTAETLKGVKPEEAEKVIIALAVADPNNKIVVTDSQAACRNLVKERVEKNAATILKQNS